MSASNNSRTAVLERVHAATGKVADRAIGGFASLPREYRTHGALTRADCVALMIERLREYDAEVVESSPQALPGTIAAQIETRGRRTLIAPAGLPEEWLAANCAWRVDNTLTHEEIEQADGVVTAATCGIAESGTIALHHSPAEGRRVVSLLPDWHLCVLKASQVVETLPEYFERCAVAPALATFISGPSATADIEMTRIKGVHGPRFLSVIVVRDE